MAPSQSQYVSHDSSGQRPNARKFQGCSEAYCRGELGRKYQSSCFNRLSSRQWWVFSPLSIKYLCISVAIIRKEVLYRIGGALTNNCMIQILGLTKMVNISSEQIWQHTQPEDNSNSCWTRRWDLELRLVPKPDMASEITDLRMGGCVDVSSLYMFLLREKLHLKLMCVWVQILFLPFTFILFAFFIMTWVSGKTCHKTEHCSELQRNTFPLCG